MKINSAESIQPEEPIDEIRVNQGIGNLKGEELKSIEEIERLTDIEIVMFLIKHIDNPCQDPGGNNIRDFYLREAKRLREGFKNPFAKQLLEDKIRQYEQP